jgi:hypothetical protein
MPPASAVDVRTKPFIAYQTIVSFEMTFARSSKFYKTFDPYSYNLSLLLA